MPIQYVYDDAGHKTAVLVPIEEWEALTEPMEDDARLSPEEEKERSKAFAELTAGKALDLSEAMKEW